MQGLPGIKVHKRYIFLTKKVELGISRGHGVCLDGSHFWSKRSSKQWLCPNLELVESKLWSLTHWEGFRLLLT